jgi:hypothetical protein
MAAQSGFFFFTEKHILVHLAYSAYRLSAITLVMTNKTKTFFTAEGQPSDSEHCTP